MWSIELIEVDGTPRGASIPSPVAPIFFCLAPPPLSIKLQQLSLDNLLRQKVAANTGWQT